METNLTAETTTSGDLVCHCFRISRGDIEQDVRDNGGQSVPHFIRSEIRAGNCSCETLNPTGKCCLGDVERLIESLETEKGVEP
jgi:NAD(P)H-nitrite reductase large subunit